LTEAEIIEQHGKFIPSIYTPILNFLFFTLRDEEDCQTKTIQEVIEEYIIQSGYTITEEIDLYIKGIIQSISRDQKLDELGDSVSFENVVSLENTKEVEDIGKFIYGNLTTTEFNKIKKLKALSKSSNEKEAFFAYRKCLELCKKYHLEFDKIPCGVLKG